MFFCAEQNEGERENEISGETDTLQDETEERRMCKFDDKMLTLPYVAGIRAQ